MGTIVHGRSCSGTALRKKWRVHMLFEEVLEADDLGEAMRKAEALRFPDKIGNIPSLKEIRAEELTPEEGQYVPLKDEEVKKRIFTLHGQN